MTKNCFVIAGNYEQFKLGLKEERYPLNARYISSERDLRGRRGLIYFFGTYGERADDIVRIAHSLIDEGNFKAIIFED